MTHQTDPQLALSLAPSSQPITAAIIQPSYIPWRGYFHMIRRADVFIFYDDVQYDSRGWRNRNQVKGPAGKQWLTIPVHHKGSQTQDIPINEIKINWDSPWNKKHCNTITQLYRGTPFFSRYGDMVSQFYDRHDIMLSDFTIETTIAIARALGISQTTFVRSSTLNVAGRKTERLIEVLNRVGASHYISGPSARDYIDANLFAEAGIGLEYQKYEYPQYPQKFPPFDGQVTILDLLFNTGPGAPAHIWGDQNR